jgi:hypothetical protein
MSAIKQKLLKGIKEPQPDDKERINLYIESELLREFKKALGKVKPSHKIAGWIKEYLGK